MEVLSVKNASLVLCAGGRQLAKAEALGAGLMLELPLGVEDTTVAPSVLTDVAKESVLILVTRFDDPRKGSEFLGPLLQSIPPKFNVHVVGELGQDKRAALVESVVRKNVVWHFDAMAKEDLDALRSNTCATIVPSKSESFGLSFIEPMLAGRPTICFTQMDSSKREWPLFNLGRASYESCGQVAKAVETAADPSATLFPQLRKFAEGFLWENLIERYLLAYERAMAVALAGGRTRGW
jgi:glycosyltransferase involved in cell wall biosynthesis